MIELFTEIVLGFVLGFLIAYILFKVKKTSSATEALLLRQKYDDLKISFEKIDKELSENKSYIEQLQVDNASLNAENAQLINNIKEKSNEIISLRNELREEFNNIANKVLLEKSNQMTDFQNAKLNDLLNPLKEKITLFEKKIDDTYDKELREHLDLRSEVKKLYELNQKISSEANNLTKALKGEVKTMGNWGEMILERVLERSGLSKGTEYRREVVGNNIEGKIIRADVVIDLPDNKHLIIDSKFSLSAYEKYINSESKEDAKQALKIHNDRFKKHVTDLFNKNYSSSSEMNSPDFVLMFIPVEASLTVSIQGNPELFAYAWEHNIMPVTPSTLLATLKTIASVHKKANQNRNAIEIARQSGLLYDKFVGFISDLEKIGRNIDDLQNNYFASMQKLHSGKGSLIKKAEKIKLLGAKNNKNISQKYLEE